AQLKKRGYVLALCGDADPSAALDRLRRVCAEIDDDLLQLRRLARYGEVAGNVLDNKLDAGLQRGAQQRGGLLEQGAHLHRPHPRVTTAPECQDALDQIPPTLRGPPYLVDVAGRLGSALELRLDHFRVAENGGGDVV